MTPPLPGSLDEYERKAQIGRLVTRGRVAGSPEDAQVAVDIAAERLALLPKARKQHMVLGVVNLLVGGLFVVSGHSLIGGTMLALAVTALVAGPPLIRTAEARLQRSLALNRGLIGGAG